MDQSEVYWSRRLVVFIVIIGRVAHPGLLWYFSPGVGDLVFNFLKSISKSA
jgi:hypothetical protein